MKAIPTLALVGLAACTGLMSGCSLFVPKFEAPHLSVVNVEVTKAAVWEQQLKVRMRVENPNNRTLPVKGLSYTLDLGGQEFANGVSGAAFVVPANGVAEFDMNVTANMAGVLFKILGRGGGGGDAGIDYRIRGKVSLSEGLLRSIPFDQKGRFKLN